MEYHQHFLWRMICGLLVALPLSGCDYGERNRDPVAGNDTAITAGGSRSRSMYASTTLTPTATP